jgi:hypothetical protein
MQSNPQIQLKLEDSDGISCPNCNGIFFNQKFLIRKWSKLLMGTPQDHVDLIPVFRCDDCGEVLTNFFPKGMKDVESRLNLTEPVTLI